MPCIGGEVLKYCGVAREAPTSAAGSAKTTIDNTEMKEHSCVPIKSYSLKMRHLKHQISPLYMRYLKQTNLEPVRRKAAQRSCRRGEMGSHCQMSAEVSGIDEKVPEMDSDDGCIPLQMHFLKCHKIVCLNVVLKN